MTRVDIPTSGGKPYCEIDSSGCSTNLQLHALLQAHRHWENLKAETGGLSEARIRECAVFIVSCLGLSLSQLLGQNDPKTRQRTSGGVPSPKKLFGRVLRGRPGHAALEPTFTDFMQYYDDCRHFGQPKYGRIDTLDLPTCGRFVEMTLDIWDAVVHRYREEHDGDGDSFEGYEGIRCVVEELLDPEADDETGLE